MPDLVLERATAKVGLFPGTALGFIANSTDPVKVSAMPGRKRALPSVMLDEMTCDLTELSRKVLVREKDVHRQSESSGFWFDNLCRQLLTVAALAVPLTPADRIHWMLSRWGPPRRFGRLKNRIT